MKSALFDSKMEKAKNTKKISAKKAVTIKTPQQKVVKRGKVNEKVVQKKKDEPIAGTSGKQAKSGVITRKRKAVEEPSDSNNKRSVKNSGKKDL